MCVCRELHEEFGISLPAARLWWARPFPAMDAPGKTGWFLAARLTHAEVAAIRFGDEGHSPALMPISDFLAAGDAVAPLQHRLQAVLA
jgi:8-oxo-dGTP diphosphatase